VKDIVFIRVYIRYVYVQSYTDVIRKKFDILCVHRNTRNSVD
jgi:hypothetical protein